MWKVNYYRKHDYIEVFVQSDTRSFGNTYRICDVREPSWFELLFKITLETKLRMALIKAQKTADQLNAKDKRTKEQNKEIDAILEKIRQKAGADTIRW